MKKWLYIFTTGPFSSAAGQEALDAVLVGASFEQRISLLFLHDGVFQLKNTLSDNASAYRDYRKTFKALEDFDVTELYVHDLSMMARGLSQPDLAVKTQSVTSAEVAQIIQQQSRVFRF